MMAMVRVFKVPPGGAWPAVVAGGGATLAATQAPRSHPDEHAVREGVFLDSFK